MRPAPSVYLRDFMRFLERRQDALLVGTEDTHVLWGRGVDRRGRTWRHGRSAGESVGGEQEEGETPICVDPNVKTRVHWNLYSG